jgi:hypothetical protein
VVSGKTIATLGLNIYIDKTSNVLKSIMFLQKANVGIFKFRKKMEMI